MLFLRQATLMAVLGGPIAFLGPAQASPWSDAQTPAAGPARSIGTPVAGCLAGGAALPLDGPGFEVIRISRHRYFAHPLTVAFVEALGQKAQSIGVPALYIGDMSLPRGGPMPNGHASHETGLDVDIWFNLDPKPPLKPEAREDVPLPSMVKPGGAAIDPARFSARHVALLRLAATDPRVDRIFVNPAIKRALCEGYGGAGEGDRSWLRRLRPWYGHDDHFHVRLACPADSTACVPQQSVPAGDGCDASLEWWFHRPPAVPPSPQAVRRESVLPAACRKLIQP
jgi:penicillin-insensitive murein DD-endopeptidase